MPVTEKVAQNIVIIGGGLSGSLLAAQLLRLPGSRRLRIVERRAELGRGEAYSASELGHTLNGNAARMSVEPDDPNDLTQWLEGLLGQGGWPQAHGQGVPTAELFVPRGYFGDYVQQRLAEAVAQGAGQGSTLEHVCSDAVDVRCSAEGVEVDLADGHTLTADVAVLATGMYAAARTPQQRTSGLNQVAIDPWDVAAMAHLPADAQVLIIGSGLTMVDALVSLDQAGHRGPIEVYSRHGLLPHVRRQPPAWPDFLAAAPALATPLQLSRALRAQCRQAQAAGIDWQAPLDTVRVHIGRLWSQASERHKRQFVRHLRPWWESHHHRSPPQGAALMERLLGSGRLRVQAGAYRGLSAEQGAGVAIDVQLRGQSQACRREGHALINSSGIEYDWRRVRQPLPQQLLARGLIQPGPLALGVLADTHGALIGTDSRASCRLFALGPPLRGMWWESTAVTDVALQAKALARHLLQLDHG